MHIAKIHPNNAPATGRVNSSAYVTKKLMALTRWSDWLILLW